MKWAGLIRETMGLGHDEGRKYLCVLLAFKNFRVKNKPAGDSDNNTSTKRVIMPNKIYIVYLPTDAILSFQSARCDINLLPVHAQTTTTTLSCNLNCWIWEWLKLSINATWVFTKWPLTSIAEPCLVCSVLAGGMPRVCLSIITLTDMEWRFEHNELCGLIRIRSAGLTLTHFSR